MRPRVGMRLLDMGCGDGPVPLYLAAVSGLRVSALDLDSSAVAWQRRMAHRLGAEVRDFNAIRGDSRALPMADESVDLVLNLSSIEHIPGEGDREAAAELGRVLAPGGRAVATMPWSPELTESVGTAFTNSFERRYDDEALVQRLVAPSGLIEVGRVYFGEPGRRFSRAWYALPRLIRLPLRRLGPMLAGRYLRVLDAGERDRAAGVCLALQRPD